MNNYTTLFVAQVLSLPLKMIWSKVATPISVPVRKCGWLQPSRKLEKKFLD